MINSRIERNPLRIIRLVRSEIKLLFDRLEILRDNKDQVYLKRMIYIYNGETYSGMVWIIHTINNFMKHSQIRRFRCNDVFLHGILFLLQI